MERGEETFPLSPFFPVIVQYTAFSMPWCIFCYQPFSCRLKSSESAGMNYSAHQQAFFFFTFSLSHPLVVFNFDCLNGFLSYINFVLG